MNHFIQHAKSNAALFIVASLTCYIQTKNGLGHCNSHAGHVFRLKKVFDVFVVKIVHQLILYSTVRLNADDHISLWYRV